MGGHLVVPKSPFVNRRSEGACMDTRLRQPNEYVSEKDDLSLSKSRGSRPSTATNVTTPIIVFDKTERMASPGRWRATAVPMR